MNKIVIISLVYTRGLVTMPFEANALNLQQVSQNLLEKTNLQVAQNRPTYQRGYTIGEAFASAKASPLENRDPVGLSERDAIAKLDRDGYNELPSTQSRGILSILQGRGYANAWDSIQDPIFLLLVGGGIIYWILGDLQEALILLGFVVFLTVISLYQEGKTEHALEALRDLSSPRALVIRDGQRKRIAGREVVRDDILMLAEGDRVTRLQPSRKPSALRFSLTLTSATP